MTIPYMLRSGCQAAKEESVATLCSAGSRTDTPDV